LLVSYFGHFVFNSVYHVLAFVHSQPFFPFRRLCFNKTLSCFYKYEKHFHNRRSYFHKR
jgi:hypothetical protein